MIRNLIYHVWPTRHSDVWRWNVGQLLRRMDQFNGQRFVSVVTDEKAVGLEDVKAAFKGAVPANNFLHFKNDPALGEVVSFEPLMERVENIDPRHATFYAHAKGVKYPAGTQHMIHRWAEVMYSTMLDYPGLVEDALARHSLVGTFKKQGNQFGTLPPSWHYAGTFFWINHARVFADPLWRRVPRQWWGVEAWPGIVTGSAACLLMPGTAPQMQLYKRECWEKMVNPVWHRFQLDHAGLRAHCSYREVLDGLPNKRVVVTGPQRSGTMIAAKCLAVDLGVPFFTEEAFGTHDFHQFMRMVKETAAKEVTGGFVIQAPTMSAYSHLLDGCSVVFMRRDLPSILRSQRRIGWQKHEQTEKDRYFDHSRRPAALVKADAWERFQRIALGERAFDLAYDSLKGHRLWVGPEDRRGFAMRQYAKQTGG